MLYFTFLMKCRSDGNSASDCDGMLRIRLIWRIFLETIPRWCKLVVMLIHSTTPQQTKMTTHKSTFYGLVWISSQFEFIFLFKFVAQFFEAKVVSIYAICSAQVPSSFFFITAHCDTRSQVNKIIQTYARITRGSVS